MYFVIRNAGLVLLSAIFLTFGIDYSRAQCQNSATPSCAVYDTCFARYCPCSGSDEYFITYGLKYCKRFLGQSGFSATGKKWRDKTLVCLQEAIVPKLDISTNPSCDCQAMRKFAFASHVQCYLSDPSICSLPASDLANILGIVDVGSVITDQDSRKQFYDVFKKCKDDYYNQYSTQIQNKIDNMINTLESLIN